MQLSIKGASIGICISRRAGIWATIRFAVMLPCLTRQPCAIDQRSSLPADISAGFNSGRSLSKREQRATLEKAAQVRATSCMPVSSNHILGFAGNLLNTGTYNHINRRVYLQARLPGPCMAVSVEAAPDTCSSSHKDSPVEVGRGSHKRGGANAQRDPDREVEEATVRMGVRTGHVIVASAVYPMDEPPVPLPEVRNPCLLSHHMCRSRATLMPATQSRALGAANKPQALLLAKSADVVHAGAYCHCGQADTW